MTAPESKTPRTDALTDSTWDWHSLRDHARQLEQEADQTRADAASDAKRLIDDKMKLWERTIELERELTAAQAAKEAAEREVERLKGEQEAFAATAKRYTECITQWGAMERAKEAAESALAEAVERDGKDAARYRLVRERGASVWGTGQFMSVWKARESLDELLDFALSPAGKADA